MKKIEIFSILVLIPGLAHADGISEAIPGALTILAMVLVIAMVGMVNAVMYLRKGGKKAFYLSVVPAAVLFVFSVLMAVTSKAPKVFYKSPVNVFFLPSLLIFVAVSYKKIKDRSSLQFWYYVINTTSTLFLSNLIVYRYAFYLNCFFYVLYSFLYAKNMLQDEKIIKPIRLFLNAGLICLFSFLTVYLFYTFLLFLPDNHIGVFFDRVILNIGGVIQGLLPAILISQLSVFVAIKIYRNT